MDNYSMDDKLFDIIDNGIFFDVLADYSDYLDDDMTPQEATREICSEYDEPLADHDDAPYVYLAIAMAQMDHGCLQRKAKEKALQCLDLIGSRLMEESGEDQIPAEILKIKEKLTNYKGKRKPRKHIICDWKEGDVYAQKLEGQYAEKVGLTGCYLLLRTADLYSSYGDVEPLCYLSLHQKQSIPATIEDITDALYLQADFRSQFRFLVTTKDEAQYKKFFYVGNFHDITPPEKEVICPKELLSLYRVPLHLDNIEYITCARYSFYILGEELF